MTREELPATATPTFFADISTARLDPFDRALLYPEPCHLAILDDVYPMAVCAAGIAPGNGIMTHGAAASLQQPALDGKPRILKIERGDHLTHLILVEQFRIRAIQEHCITTPPVGIALRVAVTNLAPFTAA